MKSIDIDFSRIACRSFGLALVLPLLLVSGLVFAEDRMQLQSLDGIPVPAVERATAPAFLVPFGSVRVGSASLAGLQYANIGGGPVTDIVVGELAGDDPEVFAITEDNCTGMTLAPGANCVIWVRFEPVTMTEYSAEFVLTSTAVNSPELIRLTGAGIFDELFNDRFELR